MARVTMIGFNEIAKDFEAEAQRTPAKAEAMLNAGADVLAREIQNQAKAMGVYDLGKVHDSIKKKSIKRAGGNLTVEIWPSGKRVDKHHPKGERIETVAFIAEYGTSNIAPRPFMSVAVKKAENEVIDEMTKVWGELK